MSSDGEKHERHSQYITELREQDRCLPINNVGRIMKNTLPATTKVSKDAKECMQECVSEFISFVTSEATDRCTADKRKTINGEDILISLHALGFENYAEVLKIYLAKYRQQQALKNQIIYQKRDITDNRIKMKDPNVSPKQGPGIYTIDGSCTTMKNDHSIMPQQCKLNTEIQHENKIFESDRLVCNSVYDTQSTHDIKYSIPNDIPKSISTSIQDKLEQDHILMNMSKNLYHKHESSSPSENEYLNN